MGIDPRAKSVQLLERVANSIHERDQKNVTLMCFSNCEVQVVERWIEELVEELKPVNGDKNGLTT